MTTFLRSPAEDALAYALLGNPLEWRVAYPELFRRLGLGSRTQGPVLDYGCGPGVVASHIAGRYLYDVVGCDVSADMIEAAERHVARPDVRFLRLASQRVEGYPDGYFGAALCAFVLNVIDDPRLHQEIAREIHRLLRPGAPFGLLVPHPDSTGVQFSTCRSGDPGVTYAPGDPMLTRLASHGRELTVQDYYWPVDWYRSLLADAGFQDVTAAAPVAGDAEPPQPPFLLVTGRR